MKALDDVLLDDADVDLNKGRKKSKQESEEEAEYKRWQKRVDMVKWSKVNYARFIEYLQTNKEYFRKEKYDQRAREEMRRVCQRAYMNNIWYANQGDVQLFDDCFGHHKEAIPAYECTERNYIWDDPDRMTAEGRIGWYADSSYHNWWNYIHTQKFHNDLKEAKLPLEKWQRITEDVKMNNRQFFKGQKTYEESDEQYYSELTRMVL